MNATVWASIQVRLVACAGADEFKNDPERARSAAEISDGLTSPEKVTVTDVGGDGRMLVAPLEAVAPEIGTSEVVTIRNVPPTA